MSYKEKENGGTYVALVINSARAGPVPDPIIPAPTVTPVTSTHQNLQQCEL